MTAPNKKTNRKWDFESLRLEALKYQHRVDFQKKSSSAYVIAIKLGILDQICQHMRPLHKTYTIEELFETSKKYRYPSEWQSNDPNSYAAAQRSGQYKQMIAHMTPKRVRKWTDGELLVKASLFTSLNEWHQKEPHSFRAIKKRVHLLNEIRKTLKWIKASRWTEQELIDDAKPYKSRSEWQRNSSGYLYASRRKLIDQVAPHFKKPHNNSKEESEIIDWIKSLGINCQAAKFKGYFLDIHIPVLNVGIEFNGLYWHCEEGLLKSNRGLTKTTVKKYHIDKTEFFANKGISVVHIWEHEWLYRKEQVKNFLLSKLKKAQSIGARKVDFRFVPKSEAAVFCEANHIQGFNTQTELSIGGYLNDELVVLGCFSKHHRGTKEIVLNRFCGKYGLHVSGGLSKISKMAALHYQSPIYTWVHKTLSNGDSYKKSGWKFVGEVRPEYFYFKSNKIYSKQSRAKNKVKTPPGMTEQEHAKLDGLRRVWDCGKIKLKFISNFSLQP